MQYWEKKIIDFLPQQMPDWSQNQIDVAKLLKTAIAFPSRLILFIYDMKDELIKWRRNAVFEVMLIHWPMTTDGQTASRDYDCIQVANISQFGYWKRNGQTQRKHTS